MGEAIKVRAIVLNKTDYGENDRILTLFSPDHGRLSASAKGVKKPTSRLRAGSEVFAFGEYVLVFSRGRYTVTGYESIDPFHELREDFDRLSAGALMLRVIDRSREDGEPDPEAFLLLLRGLDRLRNKEQTVAVTLSSFLLRFCALSGYQPVLDTCVRCGKTGDLAFLSPALGGVTCPDCRDESRVPVSGACLYYMKQLLSGGEETAQIRPTEAQGRELYRVCCRYTAYFFDHRIKLMEYIAKYDLV